MRTFFCLSVISILLILSSCTSTSYVAFNNPTKKSPNVEIFLKGVKSPIKEYEIIAYIETTGAIFTTQRQLVEALKVKSEKLGSDAIMEVDFFYIPWALSSLPSVKGIAIKYK